MDFSAKRLALLAGVGDSEDRHEIVREYAQQLNESTEARQLNEDEDAVRKAVRRTIQKMVSEGAITLQEDSIARELEHLRANIQADHDHIAALADDMHGDKDEIERAEHHREEEMHEEVVNEDDSGLKSLAPKQEKMLAMMKAAVMQGADLEELPDGTLKIKAQPKVAVGGPEPEEAEVSVDEADELEENINESDESLKRLQMLAGVKILSEGYTDEEENLGEGHYGKDTLSKTHQDGEGEEADPELDFSEGEDELEEGAHDDHLEEGDHDEAKLYELEDGRMYMEMSGKRYMMQEMEEEQLDEKLTDLPDDAMYDEETGQVVVPHDDETA
jgi:hypothetical protein